MDDYGKLIGSDTLVFQRLLPGTVEQVWEYLVDPEKRKLWFAGGSSYLDSGVDSQLVFNNEQLSEEHDPTPEKYSEFGEGFVSEAKVIRIEPPYLLEIEWEGTVKFELIQVNENVKLTLTHSRHKEDREAKIGTLAGWHAHLNIFRLILNGQQVPGFWKTHDKLEQEYSKRV